MIQESESVKINTARLLVDLVNQLRIENESRSQCRGHGAGGNGQKTVDAETMMRGRAVIAGSGDRPFVIAKKATPRAN